MNTQKQISLMVLLVFMLLGGCAAYTVYDQPRENSAAHAQAATLAERGARIFARYCRQCHGDSGQGRIGPALNRPELRDPNNLQANTQWITDTISCGRIGKIMPPWAIPQGGALDTEQINDLVALITTNAGDGWKKAGEFSAIENKAAEEPSIPDTLKAASITGSGTVRVCGQFAPTPEAAAAASNQPPAGVTAKADWTETATDNKFSTAAIVVTAGEPATLNFVNNGQAQHNWDVKDVTGAATLKDDSGKDVMVPIGGNGAKEAITFTLKTPGTYNFQCDVHPTEMTGKLYVVPAGGGSAGTPAAGAAPAGNSASAASGSVALTTTDNAFSATTITAPAGKPVTLTLTNKGTAIHNFDVTDMKDDAGKAIMVDLTQAGQTNKITFTISKPGTYKYQCDVHPTEMIGQLIIQ